MTQEHILVTKIDNKQQYKLLIYIGYFLLYDLLSFTTDNKPSPLKTKVNQRAFANSKIC